MRHRRTFLSWTPAQRRQYARALRFVTKKHKGQKRRGGMPMLSHVCHVSALVQLAMDATREGTRNERFAIALGALGHDLLEDTNATEKEIRRVFGDRAYELIWGMTNEWGDKYAKKYAEKVAASEEAVRIIKLADHYDNYSNAAYHLHMLDHRVVTGFLLPILKPMREALWRSRFRTYSKTAELLKRCVQAASTMLDTELQTR